MITTEQKVYLEQYGWDVKLENITLYRDEINYFAWVGLCQQLKVDINQDSITLLIVGVQ